MSEKKEETAGLGQKIVFGTIMFVISMVYYLVIVNKALMVMQNLAYPY